MPEERARLQKHIEKLFSFFKPKRVTPADSYEMVEEKSLMELIRGVKSTSTIPTGKVVKIMPKARETEDIYFLKKVFEECAHSNIELWRESHPAFQKYRTSSSSKIAARPESVPTSPSTSSSTTSSPNSPVLSSKQVMTPPQTSKRKSPFMMRDPNSAYLPVVEEYAPMWLFKLGDHDDSYQNNYSNEVQSDSQMYQQLFKTHSHDFLVLQCKIEKTRREYLVRSSFPRRKQSNGL